MVVGRGGGVRGFSVAYPAGLREYSALARAETVLDQEAVRFVKHQSHDDGGNAGKPTT